MNIIVHRSRYSASYQQKNQVLFYQNKNPKLNTRETTKIVENVNIFKPQQVTTNENMFLLTNRPLHSLKYYDS